MKKDFDGWNRKKKTLETSDKKTPLFHEREIWWCSVGHNIGNEACGKNELYERPVLITKRYGATLFIGIPLTSVEKKEDDRFHYLLQSVTFNNSELNNPPASNIMLSHVKSMSSIRLIRRMGRISRSELKKVRMAMQNLI